jgi:FkbM family methyltransferase
MKLASFRRQLFQSALDTDHLAATLLRWPKWLYCCATGFQPIARFETGGIRMKLVPRLTRFGTTSLFIRRDNYEPELPMIGKFIERGSIALDIGASYGVFSLFMAHAVGQNGRVYSFEPGAFSYEQLTRNISLNPALAGVIKVFNVAAGDNRAVLKLYKIGGAPVTASMGGEDGVPYDEVPAERVADLVPREEHQRVSFIKIDVEGFERTALEGTRAILEASHPTIMFEVSAAALARQGLTPKDIYDFLSTFGYSFYRLNAQKELKPIDSYDEGNIFAVFGSKMRV